MCPDKELLSSFVDGEIPSPWRERIENHLAGCSSCSSTVQALQRLKENLQRAESADEARLLDEAAARIAASVDFEASNPSHSERFFTQLWSWKVSLPIPFLAAGAAALLLAGLALGAFRPPALKGAMASTTRTLQSQQVSLASIARNVRQTSLQPVMIDIPAESVFSQYGNPVIMSFEEPSIQEVSTTSAGDR
ncbi:MAG: zf-HC2 domain-containing protein [Spirochaetes bacterium]|nr:zf-HC2 domain-containing protein [Spirochaetota bacterium]